MKKAMISQPMHGLSNEEIMRVRGEFVDYAAKENLEVVNTYFHGGQFREDYLTEVGVVHIPLYYLAKSLEIMSECHVAYFAKGWETARGCKIEHEAAVGYGLEIIYE